MATKKQPAAEPTESPFAPSGPPPVNTAQLVERLAQLQKDVAAADRERATADTLLGQAKKDLAEIDAQLKQLGVDPAKADEALTQLEQELATLTTQFEQQVAEERAAYQKIVAAAS